jgi:uncharacterized protein YlxW (UPF0749 family)
MSMSASSAVAVGLAALLGVSGFAYLDLRNQLNRKEDGNTSLQTERQKLNQQVENLQQQLNASNKKVGDLRNDLERSRRDVQTYQGQVKTLSVCLKGVVEVINQASQGNQGGAFLSFSSVSSECREADTIIQEQNSNTYSQEQLPATTRVSF